MSTCIIFASKHGTTAEIAVRLSERLQEENPVLFNLDTTQEPNFADFDNVIIGGPVYAGNISPQVRTFVETAMDKGIMSKKVGLFVCGMVPEPEKRRQEIETAFPEALLSHASAVAFLGGAFKIEDMNFLEKLAVRFVAKTTESVSAIDDAAIEEFCRQWKS